MTFLRRLALSCIFFLAPASLGASGLTPLTDRTDILGWEAVGRIDIGGKGYCTGVLIASDLVLTAAHCVFDSETSLLRDAGSFSFAAGYQDGQAIETRAVQQVVAHANYKAALGPITSNIRHDVALLKLAEPISTFTAAPFAIHSGIAPGNSVSVVSYGKGRDDVMSWQKQCDVLGRGAGLIAFNCDVTFGSSGAPVFVKEGNRARIVSLVSSGRNADGDVVAFGMDLPANIAHLKRTLRVLPRYSNTATSTTTRANAPTGITRISVGFDRKSTSAKFVKSGN
ncbi:trypsin-like serine peptidase [Neptunicoccus sediminis]|uniref:trypsin-like serine peptidase n=1 Tax=Neptunicoccus sediminis TaxID=1892596 RepID=UPI000845DF47|nr:trypsin-like peptidase domain-containing protein [Neptunicoccus sediminis]